MLILLRILFGAALAGVMASAIAAGDRNVAGDVTPGFYLMLGVILALANGIVWAPWVGAKIAGPLDTMYIGEGGEVKPNTWLRFAHWCAAHRWRRMALLLAFAEGVRHPDLPGAFIAGLHNTKPGSWLEKVFAREVYRFNNVQNAVRAWEILNARGLELPPHPNPEVNATLISMRHRERPAKEPLAVPDAPEPALERNPRIRLFGDSTPDPTAAGNPPAETSTGSEDGTP